MADETLGNLQAKISIDSSAFEAVQAKAEHFGESLKGTFGGIAAAVGIGFGLDKAVGLIDESIKAAEGLEVAQRQVGQVFGTSADQVNAFADQSVQKLGLTKSAALDAMGGMGRMLEGLGIGQQQAADDTVKLQQRIADLASASGKSQDEVTNAIQAGLRGRGMALKNYGIVIDNTKLAQEAMDQGLIKGTDTSEKYKIAKEKEAIAQDNYNKMVKQHGEQSLQTQKALITLQTAQDAVTKSTDAAAPKLTDQIKAQAALGLILKDSANTAGDFGSTAADKMAKYHAAIDQAKESLGMGLLPVVTQFSDWVGSHSTDIEHFAKAVGDGLGTAAHDLGLAFQWVTDHKDALIPVAEALTALFVASKTAKIASDFLGPLQGLVTGGAGGLGWLARLLGIGGSVTAGVGAGAGAAEGAGAGAAGAAGAAAGGTAIGAAALAIGAGAAAYFGSKVISGHTGSNWWLAQNVLQANANGFAGRPTPARPAGGGQGAGDLGEQGILTLNGFGNSALQEQQDFVTMLHDGRLKTQDQIDFFKAHWADLTKASDDSFTRQNEIEEALATADREAHPAIDTFGTGWLGTPYLVNGIVDHMTTIHTGTGHTANDTTDMAVSMGVMRSNVDNMVPPLAGWGDGGDINKAARGIGDDMVQSAGSMRLINQAYDAWQQALAPFRGFRPGAYKDDQGRSPGDPGYGSAPVGVGDNAGTGPVVNLTTHWHGLQPHQVQGALDGAVNQIVTALGAG